MNKYELELYVTGNSQRSEIAIRGLKQVLEDSQNCEYTLKVIDVLESPELAEDEKIMATPTLIKRIPPPVRRLVGDMTNIDKVKYYLDIR